MTVTTGSIGWQRNDRFSTGASIVLSLAVIAWGLSVAMQRSDPIPPVAKPKPEIQKASPSSSEPGVATPVVVYLPPPPEHSSPPTPKPQPAPVRQVPPQVEPSEVEPEPTVERAPLRPTPPPAQPPSPKHRKILTVTPKPIARPVVVKPIQNVAAVITRKSPTPKFVKKAETAAAVSYAKALRRGRVLLRNLEHGKGPSIEIAWPDAASARAKLYDQLIRCHGMRAALMTSGGVLYADLGRRGQKWTLNLDRFSGFVRRPSGALPARERREFAKIEARHGRLLGAAAVRVFDRRSDASLLAGLGGLIGRAYGDTGDIRAAYTLSGRHVAIHRVTVNGKPISGQFIVFGARSCR
ncbi:MAG: hypothetical protein HOH65_15780 [Rhodospirillaceae bacterium]|nr:hypothetical protein [Rhodospirillaceae bacterium]